MRLSNWQRRIPRLRESVGRVGHVGAGGARRHVVALGDSVAAGVGVKRGEDTVAGRLAARLADTGESASWAIHARGGLTARGVTGLLGRPGVADDVAAADVVVVSVGVNDLLRLRPLALWRRDLGVLLDRLTSATGARVVLLGMPPMAAFPSLSRRVREPLGHLAARRDRVGANLADRHGVHHLPLPADLLVVEGAFADDGFHPSARAHDQLAGLVVDALAADRRTRGGTDAVR